MKLPKFGSVLSEDDALKLLNEKARTYSIQQWRIEDNFILVSIRNTYQLKPKGKPYYYFVRHKGKKLLVIKPV